MVFATAGPTSTSNHLPLELLEVYGQVPHARYRYNAGLF
jgi:hypothetical protein